MYRVRWGKTLYKKFNGFTSYTAQIGYNELILDYNYEESEKMLVPIEEIVWNTTDDEKSKI